MNCQQAGLLIDSYADGELDAAGILELEKHLRECPACAHALQNLKGLKKAVTQDPLFFAAPAELRLKLKAGLHSQIASNPMQSLWNWNWLTAAASAVAVVCFALWLAAVLTRSSAQQQLTREIVSSHVRSLMANHELDVASSDQHTVKPWFDGKLDFSPPVTDLAKQEFPLIGGRLDYLGNRPVAALVFHRNKHVINLFIWPATQSDQKPVTSGSIQGYNLVHWSETGMTFWAVSDVNETELMEFSRDFVSATAKAPSGR